MVAMKNAFEVQMYPKLKFLSKPFNYKDFIDAVNELAPKVEEKHVTVVDKKGEKVVVGETNEMSAEMKAEMGKAREIQRNLMPSKFPDTPGYDLYGFYKPFDQIGGDYYDVIPIDQDHVGILIADVSGHGISGAMVMVMIRSVIRTWINSTTSPKELLCKANPLIVRDILQGMFVTVYYAVVDMPQKKIICACAGHNPAILWRSKTKTSAFTQKGGMPMGILAGKAFETTVKEEVIQIEPGDRLILYTDGVVETKNPNYEDFGDDRFLALINKLAFQTSEIFVNQIIHAVLSFQATALQNDDITIVTVRATK
jgi:sigma-B regulation protein RsbU (phosphoserine phosphatase)